MRINQQLVDDTLRRFRRARWDPEAVGRRIGEGDRSRFASVSQREGRLSTLLSETGNPASARVALERLIGGNDLVGIAFLARGTFAGRSVCRIHLRDAAGNSLGFGTGFLVAPGIAMTNHHVITGARDAANALAEFDYEVDARGVEKPVVSFPITPDGLLTSEELDFTLVRLAPRSRDGLRAIEDLSWLVLNGEPGKTVVGEYLTIIQHPGGEPKQVCVRENKLLRYDQDRPTLWYATDTVAGSSGSPVFNQSWQVVALHHSGVPRTDKDGRWLTVDGRPWDSSMDESQVDWIANEGIRVSAILARLRDGYPRDPVAQAVVTPSVPPTGSGERSDAAGPTSRFRDGALEVTIPIRVSVRVGEPPMRPSAAVPPASAAPAPPTTGSPGLRLPVASDAIEAVTVDQKTYDRRPGYQADFLGRGNLRVPLPGMAPALRAKAILRGRKPAELRYWNYSVMMHRARRLAIFAAVNVDAGQRPSDTTREGDQWYFDTRIPEQAQIGPEFYGEQRQFEADRSLNPFDRGHLVRRLDAQWGATVQVAKRNGDDSFHWTNCSPQHWKFNQGAKRWLGLEDYVITSFSGGRRACVINGPVFDAPESRIGPDGRPRPDPRGPKKKDPVFGGVAIPKLFFKVVACTRADGTLGAAAFLLSQEDLLATDSRIRPEEKLSDAEAKLFQVSVADIERLTGLDFGPVEAADARAQESAGTPEPRALQRIEDVRIA